MPVRYIKFISREFVRANPDCIFVFGDNVDRIGFGGQAASMRGEPNAIGVATKRSPGMADCDFFNQAIKADWAVLRRDIDLVAQAVDAGKIVYVPLDGLGTGLSQLPVRASDMHQYIIERFRQLSGDACPW